MTKRHKHRARQQRQTHRARKPGPQVAKPQVRAMDEERRRRMIRDPWRSDDDMGMALAATAAAILSVRHKPEDG